jgi:hypothetical protein
MLKHMVCRLHTDTITLRKKGNEVTLEEIHFSWFCYRGNELRFSVTVRC